jgi:hypothetical protein
VLYLRVVDEDVEAAVGELLHLGLARCDALLACHVQLRGAQALRGQVLEGVGVARGGDDMASCWRVQPSQSVRCCFHKRTSFVEFERQGVADAAGRAAVHIVSSSWAEDLISRWDVAYPVMRTVFWCEDIVMIKRHNTALVDSMVGMASLMR